MKNVALVLLLTILTFGVIAEPTYVFAKGGNSGSSHMDDDHDEDEDDDDDSDSDDDSDDDNSSSDSLEIEADVFTDTTIVKVELENGRKTVFSTEADTRTEVVDAILDRFDLTREEVEAILDFEVEDRASRADDRKGVNGLIHRHVKDRIENCSTGSTTLEIEADVFTDTTIVKVELENGRKTVFKTDATTSEEIVDIVADRFDLTEAEVEAVLDFEVEDRRSRARDSVLDNSSDSSSCDDPDNDSNDNTDRNDRDAQIARLQELIRQLIALFNLQFGGNL